MMDDQVVPQPIPQTSHWCEALAVLKLVVGKFASRVPSELVPANTYKGLPGKSLEFQFDVSEVCAELIGILCENDWLHYGTVFSGVVQ